MPLMIGKQVLEHKTLYRKYGEMKEMEAKNYAFFTAIRKDDFGTVKTMVAADPMLINSPAPKRPLETRWMSPLQVALCTGWHKKIAWFLLEHGADVNYCAGKNLCKEAYPVLFDAVNTAIWNARRLEWNGEHIENLLWKHTKEEADDAFCFLQRMIELGADVSLTDHYGRNVLMEAVGEANRICPNVNTQTGEDYPGHPITPEMREDIRRILRLLIGAGADRENVSSFSKMNIRQHYENESIWRVCGDLFD